MKILTLTGPSCSGKTTLLNELVENHEFKSIVSHTTRPMRTSEVEGVDYYFISEAEFDTLLAEDAFLEHISFNNCRYGVSLSEIEKAEAANKKAVLILEPAGLIQVKNLASIDNTIEIKSVYIGGDSLTLIERYLARAAEDDFTIEEVSKRHAKRIDSLVKEIFNWRPWLLVMPGVDVEKNPGSIRYDIILDKLDSENFNKVINQLSTLELSNG